YRFGNCGGRASRDQANPGRQVPATNDRSPSALKLSQNGDRTLVLGVLSPFWDSFLAMICAPLAKHFFTNHNRRRSPNARVLMRTDTWLRPTIIRPNPTQAATQADWTTLSRGLKRPGT